MNAFIETHCALPPIELSKRLRRLYLIWQNEGWSVELRAVALVLADLVDQGWWVTAVGRSIQLEPPGRRLQGETVEEAKGRLRDAFRIGRNRQLAEPSVMRFLAQMHRRVKRNGRPSSIDDVIDDGRSLAAALKSCLMLNPDEAANALDGVVHPVVQLCDDQARCEHTGLRLLDIWRYFRHTWSMEYRSIPGRQMPLLVRNAARPNAPVIGIALLASPVVRMKTRDDWIGWTPEAFLKKLRDGELRQHAQQAIRALADRIDQNLRDIRTDDLNLSIEELENPTFQTVVRIQARAGGAAKARQRELQADYAEMIEADGKVRSQLDPTKSGTVGIDWHLLSSDPLFIFKRADNVWRLLAAKRVFRAMNWSTDGDGLISQLIEHPEGQKALSTALQEVRKAGLSSQVADLSVCGAVSPYSVLLGGKLVALLMGSAEVRSLYARRYGGQISIISSQMAGRAISRPANLKVLTTTSLYGNGSSQYNRLRLRTEGHHELSEAIEWHELERTIGYGTYHLSSETLRALRMVGERAYGARRINNRFGEGASPRLRQTREGLTALGIDSTQILHHATPRLSYGCELHTGAIEELLGLGVQTNGGGNTVDAIATAWKRRWLFGRIHQPQILERLARCDAKTVKADMLVPDGNGQLEIVL